MSDKKRRTLQSKLQVKIMLFFSENEGSIDTPRGISAWINESVQTVRVALEDLVKSGFLKAHRTSSTVGYSCAVSKKELTRILSPFQIP